MDALEESAAGCSANPWWDAGTLASMTDASFCARVIGEFLKSACCAVYAGCHVIDYTDLNKSVIVDVARRFGMETEDDDIEHVEMSLRVYSKEPLGKRVFIDDREFKQAKATEELRKEIHIWAQPAYDNLTVTSVTSGFGSKR
jgi:hypothetical protein